MSASDPNRPSQPRKHDEPDRILNPLERTTEPQASLDEEQRDGELDALEDPQDPPDRSEASDPETVAHANAGR